MDFFQLVGFPQKIDVAKPTECARDNGAARGECHGMVHLVKESN